MRLLCFQYMQDGFSVVDASGVHVDVNPAFCQMTGFAAEELVGCPPEHLYWPPEERQTIQAAFTRTLRGDFAEIELTFMRKNGERFPVIVNPFAIQGPNGKTELYAATIKDLTRHAHLQAALRESEQGFSTLMDCAGDGILILEGDRVVECNPRALEIYGLSRDQMMSASGFSLSPQRQPNGEMSSDFYFEKVAACHSGIPQIFEWTGNKYDGTPIQTEVTLSTFLRDGKLHTLSLIRDISHRVHMENALRYSEARFRALFESAGEAIAVIEDGKFVEFNDRLPEIYGYARADIESRKTVDFFPPTQPNGQDSSEFFAEKVKASRSGTPQRYEWHGRKRDGSPVIVEITLSTFMLGDRPFEQSIMRDITRRKQMEATLLDLNKTLEKRVLQRTRELEKACAELLERNAQFRSLASQIKQAENEERRRIARFLHDNQQQLLVAAKMKMELLETTADTAELADASRQILGILEEALEASRTLTMELAPPILYGSGFAVAMQWLANWMEEHHHLGVTVVGSLPMMPIPTETSTALFQAVRELLLNVVKHAGTNQASVSMRLSDQLLEVSVADRGRGFDVTANLENRKSFGLFGIQEQLTPINGRLDIRGAPGHGTQAIISVPVGLAGAADIEERPAHTRRSRQLPGDRSGPIRVLVTENHEGARTSLVQILSREADMDVVGEAVDGLDALEKTRLLVPDVVLMDVTMPIMDGVEATRHISSEFPQINVIGFSMHAPDEAQPRMIAAGACLYLQKTRPVEELMAAIRRSTRPWHTP
ncbi:MAG: PAS domain S-box protein [Halioglobus sp.]